MQWALIGDHWLFVELTALVFPINYWVPNYKVVESELCSLDKGDASPITLIYTRAHSKRVIFTFVSPQRIGSSHWNEKIVQCKPYHYGIALYHQLASINTSIYFIFIALSRDPCSPPDWMTGVLLGSDWLLGQWTPWSLSRFLYTKKNSCPMNDVNDFKYRIILYLQRLKIFDEALLTYNILGNKH